MKTYQDQVIDVLLAVERRYMSAAEGIIAINALMGGQTSEDRDFALLAIDELVETQT